MVRRAARGFAMADIFGNADPEQGNTNAAAAPSSAQGLSETPVRSPKLLHASQGARLRRRESALPAGRRPCPRPGLSRRPRVSPELSLRASRREVRMIADNSELQADISVAPGIHWRLSRESKSRGPAGLARAMVNLASWTRPSDGNLASPRPRPA